MDRETRKEISRLEARVKELEARLAISSMPDEISSWLEDLGMEPDTDAENHRVTLDLMEEFIKGLGYKTRQYPEWNAMWFSDFFKDYELYYLNDGSIKLYLCEYLDPDADRNVLEIIKSTLDLGCDVTLDYENEAIRYCIMSSPLKPDEFGATIRFFLNVLDDSSKRLYQYYIHYKEFENTKRYRTVSALRYS